MAVTNSAREPRVKPGGLLSPIICSKWHAHADRVSDPHPFHADPDPNQGFDKFAYADPDQDPGCEKFVDTDPDPGLHFYKKIMFVYVKKAKKNFVSGSNADPDPDPDQGTQENADPDPGIRNPVLRYHKCTLE